MGAAGGGPYPGVGVGEAEGTILVDGIGLTAREPPLGGGDGTLNVFTCFGAVARPVSFLIVPVGAWAVFMLEYGLNLPFLSLSGVPSLSFTSSKLARLPTASYA